MCWCLVCPFPQILGRMGLEWQWNDILASKEVNVDEGDQVQNLPAPEVNRLEMGTERAL